MMGLHHLGPVAEALVPRMVMPMGATMVAWAAMARFAMVAGAMFRHGPPDVCRRAVVAKMGRIAILTGMPVAAGMPGRAFVAIAPVTSAIPPAVRPAVTRQHENHRQPGQNPAKIFHLHDSPLWLMPRGPMRGGFGSVDGEAAAKVYKRIETYPFGSIDHFQAMGLKPAKIEESLLPPQSTQRPQSQAFNSSTAVASVISVVHPMDMIRPVIQQVRESPYFGKSVRIRFAPHGITPRQKVCGPERFDPAAGYRHFCGGERGISLS